MSVNLKDLIKKVIMERGGEIVDKDDDFIWARMDGNLGIYYIEEKEVVTGEHVVNFNRVTEQVMGEKAIFCLKGFDNLARNVANKLKIELIPRDQIALFIGEYILQLYEKGEELPMLEEEDVEVEDIQYDEEEEEENPDVIPIIIEDMDGGEEKIIKINVSEEEALKIAKIYGGGFSAELKLVPYFIFEYSLKLSIEGSPENKTVSGIIAINGLNGKHEIWKTGYETTSTIELPHVKLEPRHALEKSRKNAKDSLIKEYTKEEEFTINDENVTIIEKRKTKPLERSIKVNFLGLYYLPVWEVVGRPGKLLINASTGEASKEDIYGITSEL